jgi:hypothetical protein
MTNYLDVLPGLSAERYNAAVRVMTPWGQDFMSSIVRQHRAGRGLSAKQEAVLAKLLAEADAKLAPKTTDEGVYLKRMVEMFDKASEKLQAPRAHFLADGCGEFYVRRAKPESRNPGHLYVTVDGQYVGKVDPNARFHPTRECHEVVTQALVEFNRDPLKAAQAYAAETGNCMFCARPLTDARSVEKSYGPICADRFGLPWGDK